MIYSGSLLKKIHESADWYTLQKGVDDRLCQTMEECGELIQACNKKRRNDVDAATAYQNLIEEVADVQICLDQLIHIYAIQTEVKEMIKRKVERDEKRRSEQAKSVRKGGIIVCGSCGEENPLCNDYCGVCGKKLVI